MSFTVFNNGAGETGSALDVMNNFYHIFDGDRLPRGGASMNPTNGVYDIGSSTYKWNQLHCVNLDFNTISTTNKIVWKQLQYLAVSVASSSVEITGLNGDNERQYMLEVHLVNATTASLYMIFNGDSSASYGVQYNGGTVGAASSAARDTGTSITICRPCKNDTTTSIYASTWATINAPSGYPKSIFKSEINSYRATNIYRMFVEAWVWTGTGTITSIKFISSDGAAIGIGTEISIWGRG